MSGGKFTDDEALARWQACEGDEEESNSSSMACSIPSIDDVLRVAIEEIDKHDKMPIREKLADLKSPKWEGMLRNLVRNLQEGRN